MNPDELQERRAARGRSGSRRQRDLDAAGIPRQSSETLAALDRSHARMAEWIDWAEKTFPELPERANIFASAGMMVKRSGRKPTRENVTARVREQLGDALCDEFGLPR